RTHRTRRSAGGELPLRRHVGAEIALLDCADAARKALLRQIWLGERFGRVFRVAPVKAARAIRTRRHAKAASDATLVINQHDPILPLECRVNGADFGAWRVI